MKSLSVFSLFLLAGLSLRAQPVFDSTAYARSFARLFPPVTLDTLSHPQDLPMEQKVMGLARVWSEARFNFANFDRLPRLDWDSAFTSFIPRVMATRDIHAYYGILQQFNQLLQDGHSRVVEPIYLFSKNNSYLPLACRYLEGEAVVAVTRDSGTEQVRAGWILEKIDGIPLDQYIRSRIAPFLNYSTPQDSLERIYRYELFRGPAGSSATLQFRDEKNQRLIRTLRRTSYDPDEKPLQFRVLENNLGYLQLNSFNTPRVVELFDSIFPTLCSTRALVIDIRSNGGGNSNNGYEVLGRLTGAPFFTNRSVIRKYQPSSRAWGNGAVSLEIAQWDWKPYKPGTYTKPVILLTSAATYSAAEDFTAAFRHLKRGLIMGGITGGSTGQPLGYNLPGGGLGFVCSKRDLAPGGEEFIGIGIAPDITVGPSREGIRQGRDEVLEAALRQLALKK